MWEIQAQLALTPRRLGLRTLLCALLLLRPGPTLHAATDTAAATPAGPALRSFYDTDWLPLDLGHLPFYPTNLPVVMHYATGFVGANLAGVATPSASYCSSNTTLSALNDGCYPQNSADDRHGACGHWPRTGTPSSCRLLYWNGGAFVPVPNVHGLGTA